MVSRLGDSLHFVKHVRHFPHGDAMPLDIRFTAAGTIPKANAGIFLLQCLLLQIKAAQGGHFEMTALGLAG